MAIRIYDSMLRDTVPLTTRDEGKVAIYVCGPTVYNYVHIGNARTFVWFDTIRSYLEYRGFTVNYTMNHTDVDDKIIERASFEKLPPEAVTAKYTAAFEADLSNLGARPPDLTVKATDHVMHMVDAISGLIDRGVAYDVDGDVFFAVEKFDGYGKLSGRSLDDLRAGERIEPHEGKRHPVDFALWKKAKEGEPSWPSPWGEGRPGWHIECSVMSTNYLGMGFDIHGGGSDLIFPHHENEIAQAEALAGSEPFVRHWMHAGMVQMDAEKMSKSLGNFVLARDVVARFGGQQVRYWALSGSYRTQAAFTESSLNDAAQAYARWKTFYSSARHALGDEAPIHTAAVRGSGAADADVTGYVARFIEAMDDDFNSAEAFSVVHDLVREGNRRIEGAQHGETADVEALTSILASFLELTRVMGFTFADAGTLDSELTGKLLDYLLELRESARSERAFERADAIRDHLSSLGVTVEDTASGARWRLGEAQPADD
jgi:cysteinyl-tRNA synthetase